jgi:hypothetical protein
LTEINWTPQAQDVKEQGEHYIMYSGTDKANAEKILERGAHEGIYLTTDPDFALNYGDYIVKFLVPKSLKVSPSNEYSFEFDAEWDTWGKHAIIAHNPEKIKAVSFDTADKMVSEHYY